MPFDLATARPVQGGFDLSTAQPVAAPQTVQQMPAQAPAQTQPTSTTKPQKSMVDLVNEKVAQFKGQGFNQYPDVPPPAGMESQWQPSPQFKGKEPSIGEKLVGAGETALTLGTGMIGGTIGTADAFLSQLAKSIRSGTYGTTEAADLIEQAAMKGAEAFTYAPRTETGKEMVKETGEALAPLSTLPPMTAELQALTSGLKQATPAMRAAIPEFNLQSKFKQTIAEDLKRASAQPELARTVRTIAEDTSAGKIDPRQLPVVIKGLEDDIVSRSGKSTFDRLSVLAEQAKAGDVEALAKISDTADDIGRVQATNKLAQYMLKGQNKVQADPIAKEATKQGFDSGVVTAIKGSTPVDRQKMLQMADMMENIKKDRMYKGGNVRPADIAGDSLLERYKYVRSVNKEAGSQLDSVAKGLKGQPVNNREPVQNFLNSLDDMGITFDENYKPVFVGSDIEGLSGPQSVIRNMVKRIVSDDPNKVPDAYELHRLKKYIDENVTYGKSGEGLKGKAENVLKSLRKDIDDTLDQQFPEYNRVNTQYSDTRQAIDALQDIAGRKMNLVGENADKSLGYLLRRLMSNTQSRVNLVDAVKNMEKTAGKYGAKFNDDVATQMLFADELDSMFGPVARTSLAGETAKGYKAAMAGAEVATGRKGAFETVMDIGKSGIDKARGVNEEKAFKVIKELLSREAD